MKNKTDSGMQQKLLASGVMLPTLPLILFCLIALLDCSAATAAPNSISVTLGRAVVALNGPWKFHTGDDPLWARPDFDDSSWENVDLTPPSPDTHDGDVGLTGYVSGWQSKGHRGYSGFAWYRKRVSVDSREEDTLALCAPYYADSAYQVFFNGQFIGGEGDFRSRRPVVYNLHMPKIFPLPQAFASGSSEDNTLVAVRVWMDPIFLRTADSGGIHIAPVLGTMRGVKSVHQHQWMEMIYGYIVDATEALLFLLLVVMVCTLIPLDRSDPAYLWMAIALVLIALARGNQAVFFWWDFESYRAFEVFTGLLFVPLTLATWTLAWCHWFHLRERAWVPKVVGILTLLYLVAQFLRRSWFTGILPRWIDSSALLSTLSVRWLFVLLTLFIMVRVMSQPGSEKWFGLPAMLFLFIGLFTVELTKFHIPGIWFPFGVGLSLNECAYIPFDVALFILLLHRLYAIKSISNTARPSVMQPQVGTVVNA
jgi:hypothetical protein